MFRAVLIVFLFASCSSAPPQNSGPAPNSPEAIEAANKAHHEKIARLRVTNPELFREKSPEEKRLEQLEYSYATLCDKQGYNKVAQLKRRFLRLELETYNQGNKIKCEKLEKDLRAAYGIK